MVATKVNKISRIKASVRMEVENVGEMVFELNGSGPREKGIEGLGDCLKSLADKMAEKIWHMESMALDAAKERIRCLEKEVEDAEGRLEVANEAIKPRKHPAMAMGRTANGSAKT